MATPQQPQQFKPVMGIVKQVLSGDSLIIRDIPRGARPAEYTVNLAYIIAPKIAKKDGKDEPYAWEAREFLREKVIGKEVYLAVEYQIPATSRDCGILFLGRDQTGENVTEAIVTEGLVEVRTSTQKPSEWQTKLKDLEAISKAALKGKWSPDLPHLHVRDVKNQIENPTNFVDSLKKQPVKAIVEHVRDGSTVRVLLLPDFYNVLVLIAGIKCPSCGPNNPEEGGEEAKYFTESRLLQRQVEVTLLGVSNQNFIGTVQHPNGNIAEFLLSQGFANCSDYSLKMLPEGREKLRAAEKQAREKRLRIWKNYTPSGVTIEAKDKEYAGKVVEVVNADALVVKTPSGQLKKIFLSSVRPPRLEEKAAEGQTDPKGRNFKPLYDIPFMYEAREFLRKKLIGKKVNVLVDYIQPASNSFPEKTCCTVTIGGINVAETLIGKGLAMVIRHKSSDVDQRSSHYDELMAAEMKAQKSQKGMHGKKDNAVHRVVDLSGDLSKSKAFFPFLERAGRMEAVVEFVASGSRLRLYIPKENKLITFLLGGISCPKATRPGPNGTRIEGEPYGEEALLFTKELCLQREVEIQVEAMDKAGNFIGWLWVEGRNLSVALVGEGLASIHFTAERSPYASELRIKQDDAKSRKEKIWQNYVEPKADELIENEDSDRNVNYKKVIITEIKPDLNFYAQHEEDGKRLEEMQSQMRQELTSSPPLPGAYTPRKGDLCVAKFSEDELWYRVRIEKVNGSAIQVFYVDFGNREETQSTKLAALPTLYHGVPYGAHEYAFACISLPKDPEILEEARYVFHHDTNNQVLKLNVEYKLAGVDYVTLVTEDGDDIVKGLIGEGLLLVERKRERRFQKFLKDYIASEEEARKKRLNLWQYGDITEDEAKEFGM